MLAVHSNHNHNDNLPVLPSNIPVLTFPFYTKLSNSSPNLVGGILKRRGCNLANFGCCRLVFTIVYVTRVRLLWLQLLSNANNRALLDLQTVNSWRSYWSYLEGALKSRNFFLWRGVVTRLYWSQCAADSLIIHYSLTSFLRFYYYLGLRVPSFLYHRAHFLTPLRYYPIYLLYWTFTSNHRLYINMRNSVDTVYNYFSLTPGLFLTFYKNKRPFKKGKLFKVLLVQYLRKVLLYSFVTRFHLIVKKTVTLFSELFRTLLLTNVTPYYLPNRSSFYRDEVFNKNAVCFRIHSFIFRKDWRGSSVKARSRGRVKRKIRRRLVSRNSLLD